MHPSGLCAAADRSGRVFVSANPLAGASSWGLPAPITKNAITGISCTSASLCAATETGGEVLVSTNPAASTPQWQPTPLEAHGSLSGISCAETLCAAVSAAGDVAVSTEPGRGALADSGPRPLAADESRDVRRGRLSRRR